MHALRIAAASKAEVGKAAVQDRDSMVSWRSYLTGGSWKKNIVTARKTSQMRLMTQAPAVMGLKVRGPICRVGTLDMGTASKGPNAIPAALHVTNAARHKNW